MLKRMTGGDGDSRIMYNKIFTRWECLLWPIKIGYYAKVGRLNWKSHAINAVVVFFPFHRGLINVGATIEFFQFCRFYELFTVYYESISNKNTKKKDKTSNSIPLWFPFLNGKMRHSQYLAFSFLIWAKYFRLSWHCWFRSIRWTSMLYI